MNSWAETHLKFSQNSRARAKVLGLARANNIAKLFEKTATMINVASTIVRESEELLSRVATVHNSGKWDQAGRQLESELDLVAHEASKPDEQVSSFAYIAAHDLQEPLRKIATFSSLLDEAIAASDQIEIERASKVIRASAAGARKLVDDILAYSGLANAQPGQLETELLDLREQVQLGLDGLSQSITETSAEIGLFSQSFRFRANRSQFARLMLNILSNAIKYRTPGMIPTINISASCADNRILLAIADNGIGFDQKFAEVIFEPFKRLHNKHENPGSGIGLAICKSICDQHGWKILVHSKVGQGTTFYFTIPAVAEVIP